MLDLAERTKKIRNDASIPQSSTAAAVSQPFDVVAAKNPVALLLHIRTRCRPQTTMPRRCPAGSS
jgi:hypothetical protein